MVFAQTTYVQRTTAWTHPLMAPPSYVEDTPEAWAVADRHLGTLRILDAAVQEPRTQIPQQIHRAVEEEAFRRNLGYLQLMCGRRALRAHNVGIDQEDLLVEGFLSVRNALQGFDLSKGTRFITYLGWWIRQGAILAMRKADFVARSSGTMDLARHVYDIQRRYGVLYNRYPTEEEIRVELAKLPIKKYQTSVISREVLESVLTLRVSLTLDAPLKTDQGDMFHVGEFPSTIDNGGRVALGVRPEHLQVVPAAQARFTIAVQMIEWVGADAYAYGQFANYRIICRLDNATSVKVGDRLPLSFDPMRVHWFDAETGKRI